LEENFSVWLPRKFEKEEENERFFRGVKSFYHLGRDKIETCNSLGRFNLLTWAILFENFWVLSFS
jgi:hypothetical protein